MSSVILLKGPDRKPDAYRVKQTDWDDFIQEFEGINCNKMCGEVNPKKLTKELFGNTEASDVFCKWCRK